MVITTTLLTVVCFLIYFRILKWNEKRTITKETQIQDPLFEFLPNGTLNSELISIIEYTGGICAVLQMFYCQDGWRSVEHFFLKFSLICLVKGVTLYITPLTPPRGITKYRDPLVTELISTDVETFVKDLMFSGHVAFLCLVLMTSAEGFQVFFSFLLLLQIAALLFYRVHYSIDIVVAPFVVYTISTLTDIALQRVN